jgi:hypothetical protein
MLGDKCLPDILKWNSLTGSRYLLPGSSSEKPSARALWYGLNSMLKSFMVVAGNKKLANASAGDSARPSQSDQEGEEVCAVYQTRKERSKFHAFGGSRMLDTFLTWLQSSFSYF